MNYTIKLIAVVLLAVSGLIGGVLMLSPQMPKVFAADDAAANDDQHREHNTHEATQDEGGHSLAHSDHGGHGHDTAHQKTVWTERFEIFYEHSTVIVNTPTEFVTHVTDLTTFTPQKSGPVTFVLQGPSGTTIPHVESRPARDGIYIPKLVFPEAGSWNLSLVIPLREKEYKISLAPIRVYASEAEAERAPIPEEVTGISFLKEQQWKIPFDSQPVQRRRVTDKEVLSIPASAVIQERGQSVVYVQVAGETFVQKKASLGNQDSGFIEVLAGLDEGEHVVVKGAAAVVAAASDDSGHQAGHAQGEHDDHAIEVIELDDEKVKKFGIQVNPVGPGRLGIVASFPGEIKLNTDKVAHIVPTSRGIVREVLRTVGDTVRAGEILAWLESAELGEAKTDYLAKLAELSCCDMELDRAQKIHDNTTQLLVLLESSPSLEALRQTNGAVMGKNRSELISAYAEFVYSEKAYIREKNLSQKNATSEEDFLRAENAFNKANALYAAARDSIAFEIQHSLLDARRNRQVRTMKLKSAERRLYILGLTMKKIQSLEHLAHQETSASHKDGICNDPTCTDCKSSAAETAVENNISPDEANEKLAWYPLRAPFDGKIIRKRITIGELISADTEVFVIADLSAVWVDLLVNLKDLPSIRKGQKVMISAGPGIPAARASIDYLDPIVDAQTRTALARVILPNPDEVFRPGIFVSATVKVENTQVNVSVDKESIQYMEDQPFVFIQNGNTFEPRSVTLGRSDNRSVEVVSGLVPGERIVSRNSFRLKAELQKRKVGDIGHGHVH